MNQSTRSPRQVPTVTGGWAWPRLFRHLGIGPSAASMLALPYLRRLPTTSPSAEPGSAARS